jgi:hypothetical protein
MVGLEAPDQSEHRHRIRILRRFHPGEQAVFFIRGVPRCSGGKVRQRSLKLASVGVADPRTVQVIGRRCQHAQEMFNPSMTIAQQAEGFVEPVIRTLPNLQWHLSLFRVKRRAVTPAPAIETPCNDECIVQRPRSKPLRIAPMRRRRTKRADSKNMPAARSGTPTVHAPNTIA